MDILGREDNMGQVFVEKDLGQYIRSDRRSDWKNG